MRLTILGFILAIGLHAQTTPPPTAPPTRNVSLTWIPSVTPNVTGANAWRCTAPCVLLPNGVPLNGITPIAVPMNGYIDTTALVGSIYIYGVTAVAPPCPNTVVALPIPACGESLLSNTSTIAVGPKPAAPGAAPALSVQ